MKKWKGDTPFAYVVQSCALELNCVRYGKEYNRKTERERKGKREGRLFVARNENDDAS